MKTGLLSEEHYNGAYKLLEEIFESCIQEADFTESIKSTSKLYDSFSGQGFEESFKAILMVVFTTAKRSTDVRKIFCFISECAVNLDNKYKSEFAKEKENEDEDDEADDVMHPLLKGLFKVLTRWSKSSSSTVRHRSCQLLYMILTYIQDNGVGEIDVETYERVSGIIEERLVDSSASVRAHAVLLAKFFQDPSAVNDPIIAGLCWQLEFDPNSHVRQNILSILAACEETIIPITKRFLYDKHAGVRNAALLHICNRINPRSFSTEHRIMIFQNCFNDSSELVRRNAEQRLIPVWFRAYKDKLCKLLKDLRSGSESLSKLPFIDELLRVLSKHLKVSNIVEEIDLDPDLSLPKSALTADRAFLWRHFYALAHNDNRLSKFLPSLDALVDFILKYFSESSVEENQASLYNELLLFLKEILETANDDLREKVCITAINSMKNPYVSHEVMPYIVTLYLDCCSKDKEQMHKNIAENLEDLIRLAQLLPEEQRQSILLKCFAMFTQFLNEETTLTNSVRVMKDSLITRYLQCGIPEIESKAITALALYCLLDIKEAKLSWSFFADKIITSDSPVKNLFLKCAFDIFKCHGHDLFMDVADSGENQFTQAVENIVSNMKNDETERNIIVRGTAALFINHLTRSTSLMAKIILPFFHPEEYLSTQNELGAFFNIYVKTRNEAEYFGQALIYVIEELFDSSKNHPYHKVNIKKACLTAIEIFKSLKNYKEYAAELQNFQCSLVLKLTGKFNKKPWRLTALELNGICSGVIPQNLEDLLQLKENVITIIENSNSPAFQQTNPFYKRSMKQMASYLKKIKQAIDSAPLKDMPNPASVSKKLSFQTDDSVSSSPKENCSPSPKITITEFASPEKSSDSSLSDNTRSSKNVPTVNKSYLDYDSEADIFDSDD